MRINKQNIILMNESSKTAGYANKSFRFVQLSDLHLSSIVQPNPLHLINKRILGYLSWLRKRRHTHQRWIADLAIDEIQKLHVDHYAITGDFTHIGLKNEFEQVAQWLQIVAPPSEMTIIPGNHDLYINERWDQSFLLWEDYLHGDDISTSHLPKPNSALDALNQQYPVVHIRGHVAFIGISSVFAAPWFRATGEVAEQQLNRLRELLGEQSLDNYCKVLLIHHPITMTHTPARKCLLNRTDLTDLLKEHPVQLVLHGHGHSTCLESITCKNNTEIPIIGISSSSSTSQSKNHKAEFLLFDVARKDSSWEIKQSNYTLDIKQKKFIPSNQQNFIVPISH